jgi:hypothetical protein
LLYHSSTCLRLFPSAPASTTTPASPASSLTLASSGGGDMTVVTTGSSKSADRTGDMTGNRRDVDSAPFNLNTYSDMSASELLNLHGHTRRNLKASSESEEMYGADQGDAASQSDTVEMSPEPVVVTESTHNSSMSTAMRLSDFVSWPGAQPQDQDQTATNAMVARMSEQLWAASKEDDPKELFCSSDPPRDDQQGLKAKSDCDVESKSDLKRPMRRRPGPSKALLVVGREGTNMATTTHKAGSDVVEYSHSEWTGINADHSARGVKNQESTTHHSLRRHTRQSDGALKVVR